MITFLLLSVLLGIVLMNERIKRMAFTLADLENAVTAQNTVIDSVSTLLNKLTDELAQANAVGDSDTIARIVGEIQSNTARLTTAVTANTPGGPAVVTPIPSTAVEVPVATVAPLPSDLNPTVEPANTTDEETPKA